MTETIGEVIGIERWHDTIHITIVLRPGESPDLQIRDWQIGEKVRVIE